MKKILSSTQPTITVKLVTNILYKRLKNIKRAKYQSWVLGLLLVFIVSLFSFFALSVLASHMTYAAIYVPGGLANPAIQNSGDGSSSACASVKVGNPSSSTPADCVDTSSGTPGGNTGTGNTGSGGPGPIVPGQVPLFKQWDPRWGQNSYGYGKTIASAGCGVTALAMLITYWTGEEHLPSETAKISLSHGWRIKNAGTSWAAMTGMPSLFGLKGKQISWEEAKRYLAMGIPVIQSHAPGYFTGGGHVIVLTGNMGNVFFVNDPDGKHRTQATESQIKASLKASWVVTK